MRIGRAAIVVGFALAVGAAPAAAQQAAVAPAPTHIEATQTFLVTWGHQRWADLQTVTAERVTVTVGSGSYTLEPGAQKSDVRLALPFRGLSTVRTDGKITGVRVDEMVFKVGDQEMRGPATVDLTEENGLFRVTGVTATAP
jgi:hypothetical protein